MTSCAPRSTNLTIIIPALNEEKALPAVLSDLHGALAHLPQLHGSEIIVVDNGSTDRTGDVAREGRAQVIKAARQGYGSACLAALEVMRAATDTIVFLDGDHSDFAEDLPALLEPIQSDTADLVIGARRPVVAGALTPQQRFGNALACALIRWLYRFRYTDLGPFRAVRRDALASLHMQDCAFGWTVEMQIKALKNKLRVCEVPVRYRPRIGQSKISGTVLGSIRAGQTILWTIAKSCVW